MTRNATTPTTVAILAFLVLLTPAGQAGLPVDDEDEDYVPQTLEAQICGREALRDGVNDNPSVGSCPGEDDYEPPLDVDEDEDADRIPDDVEAELCGRQAVADAIKAAEVAGSCASSSDFQPDDQGQAVDVPTGIELGPDEDGDGLVSHITVETTRVQATPLSQDPVTVGPVDGGEPIIVPVDPDDQDPDQPAPRPTTSTSAHAGCQENAVCLNATTTATGPTVDENVNVSPLLTPLAELGVHTGWDHETLASTTIDPKPDAGIAGQSAGIPAATVHVQGATISHDCEQGASLTIGDVWLTGLLDHYIVGEDPNEQELGTSHLAEHRCQTLDGVANPGPVEAGTP